ncbi:hypothetical protein JIG36_23345 [Actinoplanes sp. LDG1-06]|uniref:Uncharacterized protein n=1 Tax=Paractinoplanes ovalisporus TaxID=2810368 RepID=A0ABS2AF98_9ACTN|nr:hypothetical protein [Actinoplanes ovalisporus]MBM2618496.1 hypothetical protein [Actinoplanes ovalisporus]
MAVKAYDISVNEQAVGGALAAGWAGAHGPAIDPAVWPRTPRTGQPMHHRFTLWLPEGYRRRGDELVGVSVFQWCDAFYWRGPSGPEGTVHPHLHLADDGVDQVFALLWLTEAELTGPPTARPAPTAAPVEGEDDPEGKIPSYASAGPLWLRERDDPNAGLSPTDDGCVEVPNLYDKFAMEHLGGTAMSPDGPRSDLSPWYVEVNRLGGLNHGGDQDIAFDLGAAHILGDMSSHVRYGIA